MVEGVESHKPAYKVLRAVLKSNPHLNPDPNQIKLEDFALYKCHCDAYLDWIGDPSTYNEQQELESGDVQQADGVGGSAKGKEKEVDSMADGQVDQPAVLGAMDPDEDVSGPEQANVQATMENMLLGSEQELDPYQTLDQLELKDFARLFVRLRAQRESCKWMLQLRPRFPCLIFLICYFCLSRHQHQLQKLQTRPQRKRGEPLRRTGTSPTKNQVH